MSSFTKSDFKRELSRPGDRQNPPKYPFGDDLSHDPRASSTESLPPPEYEEIERRKLLVIYVHGFMGNDTSFQSFPAHVHQYLKLALFDSHVVHSKVYPRYKTYKSIDVARDNFSRWLEPLESPRTDVVLVGHSMGGLLIADIVLIPSTTQQHGYFKHRIIGTVNLDSPLLGMHPGIVVSGLSSLFRKNETPKLPGEPSSPSALNPGVANLPSPRSSMYSVPSTTSEMPPSPPPPSWRPPLSNDPNFNTNFPNDVRMEERSWWGNVLHFVKKHNSENLFDAAANHIMSHMEFGGTMFDINSLKTRYERIRGLEDVDDMNNPGLSHTPPQVRFIQYYTICTGFPKKPKAQELENKPNGQDLEQELKDLDLEQDVKNLTSVQEDLGSLPSPPHMPVDGPGIESRDERVEDECKPPSLPNSQRSSLELLSPEPLADQPQPIAGDKSVGVEDTPNDNLIQDHKVDLSTPNDSVAEDKTLTTDLTNAVADVYLDLPAVPDLPPKPDAPDLEKILDKDARKLAEKEAKRVQKAYAQAVKDRDRAVKDREKLIEKRRKKLAQEADKKAKEEKKLAQEAEKKAKEEQKKRKKESASAAAATAMSPTVSKEVDVFPSASNGEDSEHLSALGDLASSDLAPEQMAAKEKGKDVEKVEKKKLRKFCNVPTSHGQVDSKWISVFMKDMDEVAAHTSLFFAGEHYDGLVGDVGNTIVEWVQADMTKRAILDM